VNCCAGAFGDGTDGRSATVPTVAADAPPASKVAPTAPNTGTISFRRFRFEARFVIGIARFSHAF
jgi:hypothetical protein